MHILLVDDDRERAASVATHLRSATAITTVARLQSTEVVTLAPTLVLLGSDSTAFDAVAVLQALRSQTTVPVILYGRRGVDPRERARGLRAGVDDYMALPIESLELQVRIVTVLRRCGGDVRLDPLLQIAQVGEDQTVKLTPLEFRLLSYMMRLRGRPVPPHRILADVWNCDRSIERNKRARLAVYVHRLRTKIEEDPQQPRRLLCLSDGRYMLAPVSERGRPVVDSYQ
jgi:DNA-binding response OmpR family regulator